MKKKCSEELRITETPRIKINFVGADALWISEGEAKARGKIDVTEYYKFWEASDFKDYDNAEDLLNDEKGMQKVEKVDVIYSDSKKEFNTWKEFLRWLEC